MDKLENMYSEPTAWLSLNRPTALTEVTVVFTDAAVNDIAGGNSEETSTVTPSGIDEEGRKIFRAGTQIS